VQHGGSGWRACGGGAAHHRHVGLAEGSQLGDTQVLRLAGAERCPRWASGGTIEHLFRARSQGQRRAVRKLCSPIRLLPRAARDLGGTYRDFSSDLSRAEVLRKCLILLDFCNGAQGRNRTTDTVIFSHVLYQLSYLGSRRRPRQGS
jgi:hypothetical protein